MHINTFILASKGGDGSGGVGRGTEDGEGREEGVRREGGNMRHWL